MKFDQFTRKITSLAKAKKAGHLVPGNNALFRLWELKQTPQQVVENHCTVAAQKKRAEDQ